MSGEEEDGKKGMAPNGAAAVKDPKIRLEELRKETKDDHKAMAMTKEGYNRIERALDIPRPSFWPPAYPAAARGCASLFLLRHD